MAARDRLGRKTTDILVIIENLQARKVSLIFEREEVDYSSPTRRLVTQIQSSVAELERSLIEERTRAGLAAARGKGRILGRPPSVSGELLEEACALVRSGLSIRKAAAKAGIPQTHLANILRTDPNSALTVANTSSTLKC